MEPVVDLIGEPIAQEMVANGGYRHRAGIAVAWKVAVHDGLSGGRARLVERPALFQPCQLFLLNVSEGGVRGFESFFSRSFLSRLSRANGQLHVIAKRTPRLSAVVVFQATLAH